LTKDPEVKYTQSGTAVCTFTLAVDRKFAKKDSGQPTADFIPIVAWRKLAEIIGNNLVKGRRISVEGRIQVRSYDAQDGSKRYVTEIVADEVEFLDSKAQTGAQSATGGNGSFGSTVPDDEIPF
jgi:single-strand DNA-binding protein